MNNRYNSNPVGAENISNSVGAENIPVRAENIPPLRQRKSIRLKNYDYSQAGIYFVTICIQNRLHLFGEIVDGKMALNDAGEIANVCWGEIPLHYPNVQLHQYIIMPNHLHGIIEIVGAEYFPPVHTNPEYFPPVHTNPEYFPPVRGKSPLGNIVRGYKIGVTKWFQENKNNPVGKSIWQRNYWEHIVRNENENNRISQYIIDNPAKWQNDKLNCGSGNQVMEAQTKYGEEAWMV